MMTASNLGQMLGRLMYGDEIGERAKRETAAGGGTRRCDRRTQILDLVKARGSVACADLVRELGITGGNASVTLYTMYKAGQLARSGEQRAYRYSLPKR